MSNKSRNGEKTCCLFVLPESRDKLKIMSFYNRTSMIKFLTNLINEEYRKYEMNPLTNKGDKNESKSTSKK